MRQSCNVSSRMPFIRYSTLACCALATPTRLLTNTVTMSWRPLDAYRLSLDQMIQVNYRIWLATDNTINIVLILLKCSVVILFFLSDRYAPMLHPESRHTGVSEQSNMCASHTRTVVRECFKGDEASQWKRSKFDPSPHQHPLTNLHKNWQAWLRPGRNPACKIL